MTLLHRAFILAVYCLCVNKVHSQYQNFGITLGNNDNAVGGDVIRREYYEFNPPHARRYHEQHANPFGGMIPGVFIVIVSSALQWYNEGRAVRDARMLRKAERQVVELDSLAQFDPQNDGNLVHITGFIATDQGLIDPEHSLKRPDALQLIKTTEAYEWKENKSQSRRRISETETKVEVYYGYSKQWTKNHMNSNRFQSSNHYNPYPRYNLGRNVMTVSDARISNGLHVPPDLIKQIGSRHLWRAEHVSPVALVSENNLADNSNAVIVADENKLFFSGRKSQSELISLGLSQPGALPASKIPIIRSQPYPEVGDIKVSWTEVVAPKEGVSILAKQQGGKLVPWSEDSNGHTVYYLLPGKFNAKSMISDLMGKSKFITKALRVGGWIGNFFGLNLVLSCVPTLVKLLPLGVGHILEPLVSIATSTVALGASVGLSFSVISVAWLRFRPLFAACLAIVSGFGFLGPLFYARWRRSPETVILDAELKAK